MFAAIPVLYAKERILLHRIGPSQSTLFIAKMDGSDERPLLRNSGLDYNASFSADGKWIIFTSERGGSADIYRVHPDGTGLERLTDDPAYDDQAALSADGKQLAFVSSRGTGSADIWVLDLQTKKAQNLTHAPGSFRPSWSPDGKWIAFSSDRNTPVRRLDAERFAQVHAVSIYVMRADGTEVRRLTAAGKFAGSPKWSPDGKRIVFYEIEIKDTYYAMRPGFGIPVDSQIVSVDVATGARQEHTSGPGLRGPHPRSCFCLWKRTYEKAASIPRQGWWVKNFLTAVRARGFAEPESATTKAQLDDRQDHQVPTSE